MSASLPENREIFLSDLYALQARFDGLEPELVHTVSDPSMDVEGYIVVWNTKICEGGPLEYCGKGGTRITPSVSLDEVKMLARTMALKNAAAGLALGGSKAGLKADPRAEGFEAKYRRFVQLCAPFLHENGGVFGGFGFDIGAAPEHALWACDELGSTRCFTGKPVHMGGTDYDKEGIAGLGVATAAKTFLECKGLDVGAASFSVQGVGAMGAAVLRYFSEYGATLKALGDPKYGGTYRFESGASDALVDALIVQDVETARVLITQEGQKISDGTEEVLFEDVDVVFPCAVHGVLSKDNAHKVQARFISEAANQPITECGYEVLFPRGVYIVPDFIANPGGVIAAYVELTMPVSAEENAKTRAKVHESKAQTIEKISGNVRAMAELMDSYDVNSIQAGTYYALRRIFANDGVA